MDINTIYRPIRTIPQFEIDFIHDIIQKNNIAFEMLRDKKSGLQNFGWLDWLYSIRVNVIETKIT